MTRISNSGYTLQTSKSGGAGVKDFNGQHWRVTQNVPSKLLKAAQRAIASAHGSRSGAPAFQSTNALSLRISRETTMEAIDKAQPRNAGSSTELDVWRPGEASISSSGQKDLMLAGRRGRLIEVESSHRSIELESSRPKGPSTLEGTISVATLVAFGLIHVAALRPRNERP